MGVYETHALGELLDAGVALGLPLPGRCAL
jgi:hypothetical protein